MVANGTFCNFAYAITTRAFGCIICRITIDAVCTTVIVRITARLTLIEARRRRTARCRTGAVHTGFLGTTLDTRTARDTARQRVRRTFHTCGAIQTIIGFTRRGLTGTIDTRST